MKYTSQGKLKRVAPAQLAPLPQAPPRSEAETRIVALVQRAAELELLLKPFSKLKKEREYIKEQLLSVVRAGHNGPLEAPGVQVTFSTRDMPAYSVDAHTQHLMHVTRLAPAPSE